MKEKRSENSKSMEQQLRTRELVMEGQKTTRWLLNTALFFVAIIGMKAAAPLLTQLLIVLFIAIVISPVYYLLRRLRVPSWLSISIMIAAIVLLFLYVVNVVFSGALVEFTKDIPKYQEELNKSVTNLKLWLEEQGVEVSDETFTAILTVDTATVSGIVKNMTARVGAFIKDSVLVLIIVSFIIVELPSLPKKASSWPWMTEELWDKILKIVLDVRHYMSIKTIISVATGVFIYFGLLIMGIDSPVLLGVTAFALNFVPMIGSIIATIPAILIAILQYGVLQGFYVAFLYIAVNLFLGNILEPRFMGYGFGVSPVIVLLSLIFWGWVLGPLGMLFAVPLTMALRGSIESMLRETMLEN